MSKETIKAIGKSSYGYGWKVNKISFNHVTARLCLWTLIILIGTLFAFTSCSFGMNERLTAFLQSTRDYLVKIN